MSNTETTAMKLKTTPTGGVSGEHSPYYRRLLSAGYKGFLQGTIAGSGLYGLFGAAIGLTIAIPTMILAPGIGVAALWMIPAMGGVGVLKGANTFGNIGTMAAISAESADLSEQRRYLLDRYYELPDGPEGDKQAELIKDELARQNSSGQKHQLFHWRTVLTCALIGGALALLFLSPASPLAVIGMIEHTALGTALHAISEPLMEHFGASLISKTLISTGVTAAFGTAIGALAGAAAGIDRYYIRRWFDRSESLLHDDSHSWNALMERSQFLDKLKQAEITDKETKTILERQNNLRDNVVPIREASSLASPQPQTIPTDAIQPIASLDVPDTKVSAAKMQSRLADIQKAMDIPAI